MGATPGQSFGAGIVAFAGSAHKCCWSFIVGKGARMQALVELIAGLIALLAAAVLAQFGVDTHAPRGADREVHRTTDCRADAPTAVLLSETAQDC